MFLSQMKRDIELLLLLIGYISYSDTDKTHMATSTKRSHLVLSRTATS